MGTEKHIEAGVAVYAFRGGEDRGPDDYLIIRSMLHENLQAFMEKLLTFPRSEWGEHALRELRELNRVCDFLFHEIKGESGYEAYLRMTAISAAYRSAYSEWSAIYHEAVQNAPEPKGEAPVPLSAIFPGEQEAAFRTALKKLGWTDAAGRWIGRGKIGALRTVYSYMVKRGMAEKVTLAVLLRALTAAIDGLKIPGTSSLPASKEYPDDEASLKYDPELIAVRDAFR